MSRLLEDALGALPHGLEFRFLDRLLALVPGRQGIGEFTVPPGAPYLRGHFPGQPLLPGVLLIEAAAQLAGVVAQSDPDRTPLPGLKLSAVRVAKLTGTVRPGETVRLQATITGRLDRLVQAEVDAAVDGRPVLHCAVVLGGDGPIPTSASGTPLQHQENTQATPRLHG